MHQYLLNIAGKSLLIYAICVAADLLPADSITAAAVVRADDAEKFCPPVQHEMLHQTGLNKTETRDDVVQVIGWPTLYPPYASHFDHERSVKSSPLSDHESDS